MTKVNMSQTVICRPSFSGFSMIDITAFNLGFALRYMPDVYLSGFIWWGGESF